MSIFLLFLQAVPPHIAYTTYAATYTSTGSPSTKPKRRSETWKRIMLSWGETCTVSLGQIWLMLMFVVQGEQWKTPEFCLWRGKRKKIHGGKKKQNNLPEEISMVTFSGDRERTQSADLSTGDDFEVRPQRQEPFDWSSCARTRSFCSDGVRLPGLEIASPAWHWFNWSHISMLEISSHMKIIL